MKNRFLFILIISVVFLVISRSFVLAETTSALRPITDGGDDSANWSNTLNEDTCNIVNCYTHVNELSGSACANSSDGNLSYIISNTKGASQTFDIDESSIPDGSTVTQIDITVCYKRYGLSNGKFQTRYCHNSSCADSGTDISSGTEYAGSSQSHTVNFIKTSDSDIEIGVTNTAAKNTGVSKISVLITYTLPDTTSDGGGIDLIEYNTLTFSGRAFPDSQISLMEKRLQENILVSRLGEVSLIGDFFIIDTRVPVGYHTFNLVVKDKEGRQTQTKVYNIDYPGGFFSIEDILIPPTIDLASSIIAKGDFIKVFGYASFKNHVKIEIDKGLLYETFADEDGQYQLLISADKLSTGRHNIKVKQQHFSTKQESDFSITKSFLISGATTLKADLNADGEMNFQDWSIFLARWKQGKKEDKEIIDFNRDKKIDISDLSIFLKLFKTGR